MQLAVESQSIERGAINESSLVKITHSCIWRNDTQEQRILESERRNRVWSPPYSWTNPILFRLVSFQRRATLDIEEVHPFNINR
jgi:hypothetical protein